MCVCVCVCVCARIAMWTQHATRQSIHLTAHPFTHSPSYSLTHSPIPPLPHSLTPTTQPHPQTVLPSVVLSLLLSYRGQLDGHLIYDDNRQRFILIVGNYQGTVRCVDVSCGVGSCEGEFWHFIHPCSAHIYCIQEHPSMIHIRTTLTHTYHMQ